MAKKTKNQSVAIEAKHMRITVYFGYALFLLVVVTMAVWVVPWFTLFTQPDVVYINVGLMLLALISSSIVSPFVGYLIGNKATHRVSKLVHHYNGVLFGLVGMWAALIINSVVTYISWVSPVYQNEGLYGLISLAPAGIAVILLAILGVFYARHTKHQTSLINYKPYQWSLIGSVVGVLLVVGASSLFGSMYHPDLLMSIFISMITPTLFMVSLALCGYWVLGERNGTPSERLTKSLVALSMGFACWMALGQLSHYAVTWTGLFLALTAAVAFVLWVVYLFLMRRAAR